MAADKKKTLWICLFIVLGLAAAGLVAALRHRPAAYRPPSMMNDGAVSQYLTHQLAPAFFNQMQLESRFALAVEQDGFNEIVAQWRWPQKLGRVNVGTPTILFDDLYIDIICPISYQGMTFFLRLGIEPKCDTTLRFEIRSIKLGALPIRPVGLWLLNHFWKNYRPEQTDPVVYAVLNALLRQQPIEPSFELFGYRICVKDISSQKRRLILTLDSKRNCP